MTLPLTPEELARLREMAEWLALDGCDREAIRRLLDAYEALEKEHAKVRRAANFVLMWLSSFSMPPTSSIREKQEAIDVLKDALIREDDPKAGDR